MISREVVLVALGVALLNVGLGLVFHLNFLVSFLGATSVWLGARWDDLDD